MLARVPTATLFQTKGVYGRFSSTAGIQEESKTSDQLQFEEGHE